MYTKPQKCDHGFCMFMCGLFQASTHCQTITCSCCPITLLFSCPLPLTPCALPFSFPLLLPFSSLPPPLLPSSPLLSFSPSPLTPPHHHSYTHSMPMEMQETTQLMMDKYLHVISWLPWATHPQTPNLMQLQWFDTTTVHRTQRKEDLTMKQTLQVTSELPTRLLPS